MITTLLLDSSHVLIFPKDKGYTGKLSPLYARVSKEPGYKFSDHFEFNEQMLASLWSMKEQYTLCIFTSGTMPNTPEAKKKFNSLFKKIYYAKDFSYAKGEPQPYLFIADDLGKKPNEFLFIDDMIENVKGAQKAGLNTLQFKSNEQFFMEVHKLLPAQKK